MIGIYKITNPKGKVYIGQSVNIKIREAAYKQMHCKKQIRIYNSIKKYGWKQHKHEIIEECTVDQLNERETYWKKHYLNILGWENVLFCDLYDKGGGPKNEEIRKKIGASNRKPKPEGFGEKMRFPASERTKLMVSMANKGRKYTDEHKQKLIDNRIGKGLKPILQFDKQGNFIKEWPSIKEINILNTTKNISACCRGRLKTVGGFVWQYKK
jgi:group I intron endonuclease